MIEIFLSTLTTFGIIGQFFIEHISRDNIKKKVGILIMIVAVIAVWISFGIQNHDNKKLSNSLNDIKATNTELKAILKERNQDITALRNQNDSLKVLLTDFKRKQEEFIILSEASTKEISRSREILKDISNQSFTRGISEPDKIEMVAALIQHKGAKVTLTTIMGDSEAFQFASQLKEVFAAAGWKVDGINQAVYNSPVRGVKIRVQNEKYPSRVNQIIQAMNVLRLKVEGLLAKEFKVDDVEIVVGAR